MQILPPYSSILGGSAISIRIRDNGDGELSLDFPARQKVAKIYPESAQEYISGP